MRDDSFATHQAFLNGRWIGRSQLLISVDDTGFRQAATAVERLRTYGGRPFQVARHLERWQSSVSALRILDLPHPGDLADLIQELVQRNHRLIDACGDVGITLFATPGEPGGDRPTLALHLNQIDHARVAALRNDGQPLVVTDVMQPPQESWPRDIKVRCRLHYYLADQQAKAEEPTAVGLLVDRDATITETSIANVAIAEGGKIISPLPDRVLGGITQSTVEKLATAQGIPWRKEPINVQRLLAADEVLLMGTDAGLWFVNRINQKLVSRGRPGPLYQVLLEDFCRQTLQADSDEISA